MDLPRRLGLRRIAVISDANDYGTGNRAVFLAALARGGVKPVEIQSYQGDDKEFGAQLARVRAANPDALAVLGTIPAAPAIMNQAREIGISARFLGSGGLANEALLSLAPKASAGTVLTTFFSEEADSAAATWAAEYRQRFADRAEPPRPMLAAWEYRAIRSIAATCLATVPDTDRIRLRDCIARWRGRVFGVAGEVYFDKTGQLVQQPLAVEVNAGAFRPLKFD